jgi:hypothetical protein
MLYPRVLPLVSMLEVLFKDASAAKKKFRLFWIAFFGYVDIAEIFLTLLTQAEQDLYLGTLPRMDLPPFDWIFHFLHCQPAVGKLYSNLRRLKRK